MTLFQRKTFTVPSVGTGRTPTACEHGMVDPRGNCCFCGAPVPDFLGTIPPKPSHLRDGG